MAAVPGPVVSLDEVLAGISSPTRSEQQFLAGFGVEALPAEPSAVVSWTDRGEGHSLTADGDVFSAFSGVSSRMPADGSAGDPFVVGEEAISSSGLSSGVATPTVDLPDDSQDIPAGQVDRAVDPPATPELSSQAAAYILQRMSEMAIVGTPLQTILTAAVEAPSQIVAEAAVASPAEEVAVPVAESAAEPMAVDSAPEAPKIAARTVDADAREMPTIFPNQVGSVPLCVKCNLEVDPFKGRLERKVGGRAAFKCGACNVKHVQLCGIFGHWPTVECEDLSEEAVTKFWATPTKTKADVEKLVTEQVVMRFIQLKRTKNAGTYLPISVYQTQGFPVDRILAYCKDTIECPVLGTLYKVRLHSDELETIEEACKSKIYEMKQRGQEQKAARRVSLASASSATPALQDAGEAPSDRLLLTRRRRRSFSSESSGERQQRKAARREAREEEANKAKATNAKLETKRLAAEEKAVLKETRAAEQQALKVFKKTKADAARCVAKLNIVMPNVAKELFGPNIEHVAEFARLELKAASEKLHVLFREVSAKQMEAKPSPISMTLEDMTAFIKLAVMKAKVVNDFLVTVRKRRAPAAS